MCGIVGCMYKGKYLTAPELKIFENLIFLDTMRGKDSTGVVGYSLTEDYYNFKKLAVDGPTFLKSKAYEGFKTKAVKDDMTVLIGHNRAATVGVVNQANAHPFLHGYLVGVHNGTLTDWKNTLKETKKFTSDSDALIFNMNKFGVKKTLERTEGAYALAWFNRQERTLSLARNNKRPLWVGWNDSMFLFASEKWMMEAAAERNNKTLTDFKELPVGEVWTFDTQTICEIYSYKDDEGNPWPYKVEEFTPHVPKATVYHSSSYGGYNMGAAYRGSHTYQDDETFKLLEIRNVSDRDNDSRREFLCLDKKQESFEVITGWKDQAKRMKPGDVVRATGSYVNSGKYTSPSLRFSPTTGYIGAQLEVINKEHWMKRYNKPDGVCPLCREAKDWSDVPQEEVNLTSWMGDQPMCLDCSDTYREMWIPVAWSGIEVEEEEEVQLELKDDNIVNLDDYLTTDCLLCESFISCDIKEDADRGIGKVSSCEEYIEEKKGVDCMRCTKYTTCDIKGHVDATKPITFCTAFVEEKGLALLSGISHNSLFNRGAVS